MKMTEEQFEALTVWVAAKIADQTCWNEPDDYDGGLHESIRESIRESEAHSHLRRLLVDDEEPEPAMEERRVWAVQTWQRHDAVSIFGVQDQNGTWWTHRIGEIWTTPSHNQARHKAKQLNA